MPVSQLTIENNGTLWTDDFRIYNHTDGSKWLLILDNDITGMNASDSNYLFSSDSDALANYKDGISRGKYSNLTNVGACIGTDSKYEFLMLVPQADDENLGLQETLSVPWFVRWKQSTRPQDETASSSYATDWELIGTNYADTSGSYPFHGLRKFKDSGLNSTYLTGGTSSRWFYSIGLATLWGGTKGMPCIDSKGSTIVQSSTLHTMLFVRIDTMSDTTTKNALLMYGQYKERFQQLDWITVDGYDSAKWLCVYDYDYTKSGGALWTTVSQARSNKLTPYMYSDMSSVVNYIGTDGKYTLLMEYPELRRAGSANGYAIWKQSNPPTEVQMPSSGTVAGYEAVSVPWAGTNDWGGLGIYYGQSGTSTITKNTYFCGAAHASNWYYAVCPCAKYSTGFPGVSGAVTQCRVYVRVDNTTDIDEINRKIEFDKTNHFMIANEFTEI